MEVERIGSLLLKHQAMHMWMGWMGVINFSFCILFIFKMKKSASRPVVRRLRNIIQQLSSHQLDGLWTVENVLDIGIGVWLFYFYWYSGLWLI